MSRNLYHSFDVSGKRAYRPRAAGDLNVGDVVKLRRPGGRFDVARVHYIGHLPGKSEPFIGVQLQHASKRPRQLYKNISMLFLFPVKDGKLSTGVNATFDASYYG